ncbi:MAG: hypothetical protein HYU69_12295 [Bacteroidetes bacterium]|nr:hypothetical protein [Bacteroidota bacterium]
MKTVIFDKIYGSGKQQPEVPPRPGEPKEPAHLPEVMPSPAESPKAPPAPSPEVKPVPGPPVEPTR